MKKYSKLCTLLLTAFFLHGCTPNAPSKTLHDKILSKLNQYADSFKSKKAAYTALNMDNLSGLEWEKIYFFHENSGYPTDEGMSEVIGIEIKSGSIISNGTRLIFTRSNKVLAVVDFSQEENLWLYTTEGYNRNKGSKFIFYTNCDYRKSYNLQPLQNFDERTDLSGEFYKRCY